MPEVRPQSQMASPIDVLQALDDLGLHDMVLDIERTREVVCSRPCTPKIEEIPLEPEPVGDVEPEILPPIEPAVVAAEIVAVGPEILPPIEPNLLEPVPTVCASVELG